MATYHEELVEKLTRLQNARTSIRSEMCKAYAAVLKKPGDELIEEFKQDLESVLNNDPQADSFIAVYIVSDEVFDFLDVPEEDYSIKAEAIANVVEAKLAELGLSFMNVKITSSRLRTNWFSRMIKALLIGSFRSYYTITIECILLQKHLSGQLEGHKTQDASKRFIGRIKDGTLRQRLEPGEVFRQMARENGVTTKQVAEDVERVHTGQTPKYIKIERGANEHGNKSARQR